MKTCFVLCIGMITLFAFLAASSPLEANQPRDTWVRSFAAGKKDSNGQFLGGSEVHHIVGHKGKLYAATGYWMDANNTYYSAGKRNQ